MKVYMVWRGKKGKGGKKGFKGNKVLKGNKVVKGELKFSKG